MQRKNQCCAMITSEPVLKDTADINNTQMRSNWTAILLLLICSLIVYHNLLDLSLDQFRSEILEK